MQRSENQVLGDNGSFKSSYSVRHLQRIAGDVAKYFVPAVIFIAISAGVGWYFVGVTGVTFSVTGVTFSLLSFFSVIILAVVLVLLVLLVLLH
jgi:cation transport ATPase